MKIWFLVLFLSFLSQTTFAKTVRYELTIKNEKVNLSGKKEVDFALTVNGGIPAPTLEFTEGDDAEILVKNEILNEEVSIHWHGILLPPVEDGVAYVNTPPIHPGTSRLFKFKIRQSGTYWYHSHTGLQEQKGVYGGLVIHPKQKSFAYDKEAVVVLSDWSDENSDQIVRNLRKDGDFYLYKKDSMRSYVGAIKAGGLKNHLHNEWTRMGGMDLSDVGYDAFLINGKRDSQLLVAHPGEKVRLRIINAAASSYFYVSLAGLPMTVVSADGVDIEPIQAKELLMGMAETYDVLFTVPSDHKNYELRATVQDVTGYASAWIGMNEKVSAPNKPLPDMYASMDHGSHGGNHDSHGNHNMDHSAHHQSNASSTSSEGHEHHVDHSMHAEHGEHTKKKPEVLRTTRKTGPIDWSTQSDAMLRQNDAARDVNPKGPVIETLTVDSLKSIGPTTLPKEAKVQDVKLVLNGDMERYVWHLNGKAIHQDRLLMINKGEVVRFTFVNETMMHHPMHFHGHFFRVINENGEYSPLKHTVDVPPHQTRTIEFFSNEPGQWMLHCHNLYHMKTGMARVVRYNDFKLTPEAAKFDAQDPHLHDHMYTHGSLGVSSNYLQGQFRIMKTWDEIDFSVEATDGGEARDFRIAKKWEAEADLYYRRWFSNFLNVFGGGTLHDEKGFGTVGVGYVLPMLIESEVSVNHKGFITLELEKRFQWTKNIFSEVEFGWRPNWDGESKTEYKANLMYGPSWSWAAGFTLTDKNIGFGAKVQF